MKKIWLILLFLFLFKIDKIYAVTTSILNVPSEITADPFTIVASVSGNISGTHFLRIDLFKENTTNYFGQTNNGSSWYGGSEGTQYFPITVTDGFWSGSLQGKVGDPSLTEYPGPGSYRMRVRRYTSSGGSGNSDEQSVGVNISVNLPTPTPTTASSPTNTPAPTNSPIPTKIPTSKPTQKAVITTLPAKKPTQTSDSLGTVLGSEEEEPSPTTVVKESSVVKGGAKITLVLGMLLLGVAIMVFTERLQQIKK